MPPLLLNVADDGVGGALADAPAVGQVDAAHARLGRELDEACPVRQASSRQAAAVRGMLAIQLDDALALGRLVGDRGQGGQVAHLRGGAVAQRHETASPGGCPS